jgi:phospholipase C
MSRKRTLLALLFVGVLAGAAVIVAGLAGAAPGPPAGPPPGPPPRTKTPIKHVVVIFQENVSFDHYFGTYPSATNTDGQPFDARPGTPPVDGLLPATDSSLPAPLQHTSDLTELGAPNNPNAAAPQRLDSSPDGLTGDAGGQETCDQDHNYSDEQQSFDGGKMDQFVQAVGTDGGTHTPNGAALCSAATVMDYYDGNSTTALWNYAQHYSVSDNSFGTTFGPSAPGAVNLASGNTGNVDTAHESQISATKIATATAPDADLTPDGLGGFSLTGDAQPYWDDCSTRDAVALSGTNIGDELNSAGISWGWFQGGFAPSTSFAAAIKAPQISSVHPSQTTAQFFPDEFAGSFDGKFLPAAATTGGLPAGLGTASNQGLCNTYHAIGVALGSTAATDPSGSDPSKAPWGYKDDYIAHHEPFQFYASTANPHHLAPASLSAIGWDTQSYANDVP